MPRANASTIQVTFNGNFLNIGRFSDVIPEGTPYSGVIRYDDHPAGGPVFFAPSPGDSFDAQIGPYLFGGRVIGPFSVSGVMQPYRFSPDNFRVLALLP